MNQNERKTVARRMILLIAVACVIMGLYVMRLIFLQLVNGDDFKAKATNTTDYNFTVTAARGDIVDSAGRRIATTATSYTNTGAKAGTTYYYRVKACNDAGLSPYSNVVSGRATVTTLTMGHSASSGKPMLTWNAVSGATSYKVYRATSKSGTYSLLGTVTATSYTNTGAKAGTTYYYKVVAVKGTAVSDFSNIVTARPSSKTVSPVIPAKTIEAPAAAKERVWDITALFPVASQTSAAPSPAVRA